jgi:hypothetical protein
MTGVISRGYSGKKQSWEEATWEAQKKDKEDEYVDWSSWLRIGFNGGLL